MRDLVDVDNINDGRDGRIGDAPGDRGERRRRVWVPRAATGRGDDGAVGASDGIRTDEREDADAHGSRLAGVPTASLGGDGVNESSAASTPSRIAAPKAVGRAPRVLRSKSRPPRTSSSRRTALNNAS